MKKGHWHRVLSLFRRVRIGKANMNKTLTFRPLKSMLFIGTVFLFSTSMRISMPQNRQDRSGRLDVPSARTAIQDPVPLSLVKKIAAAKAKQVWGEGALGKPIPLCNPAGDLVAWMFSYCIGSTTFPTYDAILQQIKMGRQLKDLVERSEFSEAKELYKSLLECDSRQALAAPIPPTPVSPGGSRLGQMEPVRADGTRSRRAQVAETAELRKYGEDKAIGAGEFGTIVVSATYRRVPVPVYLHYLAPYYTHFDLALEKARTLIGEGASLEQIYFLRLRGLFFEFVNNGNAIVLHAQTLEPTDIALGKSSQENGVPKSPATAAAREQINKLWAEIQREIQ